MCQLPCWVLRIQGEPNRLSTLPGDKIWATRMVSLTQFKKCIHQAPSPHQPLYRVQVLTDKSD